MGLFSFIKDAGAEYLGIGKTEAEEVAETRANFEKKNKDAADKMIAEVNKSGLAVNDFGVAITGETAYAFGEAPSQASREKAILIVGNTGGIATVDDRMFVKVEAPQEPQATFHTVKAGDSLSKISKEVYGDPMKYEAIFEANKPMLSHPDKIYPGQVLRCPAQ